jgi:hypothetical protein
LTLGASLVAGLISWAGGEWTFPRFRLSDNIIYPPDFKQLTGYHKQAVKSNIETAAHAVTERKRAMAAFGFLGLVLGGFLGLSGGLAAGSARSAFTGAAFGAVAGPAIGAALSFAFVPLFFRFLNPEQGLLILSLTQAGIFAGIGAVSGTALGVGLNDRSALGRALFGGLLGALLGTVLFGTVLSLAFPLFRTFEPIPTEPIPRLMMHLSVAVCIGVLAGLAVIRRPGKSVAVPVE